MGHRSTYQNRFLIGDSWCTCYCLYSSLAFYLSSSFKDSGNKNMVYAKATSPSVRFKVEANLVDTKPPKAYPFSKFKIKTQFIAEI